MSSGAPYSRTSTIQRLLHLAGGLKQYQGAQDPADQAGARDCPFCPSPHRLRRHGSYERWAYVPDGNRFVEEKLTIHRFLCSVVGRTLSLLPDFCLPHRQYGPAPLGVLLDAYALEKESLLAAFRRLRPEAERHSGAQSLIGGFLRRRPELATFIAALRPRTPVPPRSLSGPRLEIARLFLPLRVGFTDGAAALLHHGLAFHRRFQFGLA